jgi:aspartyl/asparaginyl beta-hydroxylase (cupin superfamily)
MSFNFKLHGNLNVNSIKEKLIGLDWDAYEFRQKTYSVHSNTKTIPLLWDEQKTSIMNWPTYELFKSNINEIELLLNTIIGNGIIETAILINLPKNQKIDSHFDSGEYFLKRNRIHIPIITNKQCFFKIDGQIKNMKEGEIWEINNNEKEHSVENNGNKDRIHLLIDFLPIPNMVTKKITLI